MFFGLISYTFGYICDDPKGLGTVVFIGAGLEKSGDLNYIPLLCGRTVRGSIYGGVRTQTDLPKIIEKCVNKVCMYID